MIGISDGNGHPFSFSAIVNGYDRTEFEAAGWPVILAYLERQPAASFGFGEVQITHAWTQDPAVTARLCAACRIPIAVANPIDMVGDIDALIVARDDWRSHAAIALPFLQKGVPVFVDKPLTLDDVELERFRPYLHDGLLMSTSGLRYAVELDRLRTRLQDIGALRLVCATVLHDMEKYGIHMLDAMAGLGLPQPVAIARLAASHQSYALTLDGGILMHLDCLGDVGRTFHLSLFGDRGHAHEDLHDNFTAFRRTLGHFFRMVQDRKPPIEPRQVIRAMQLIRRAQNITPGQTTELAHA